LPDGVLETVGAALIDGVALVGALDVVGAVLVDGVVLGAKLGAALGIPKGIADGSTLHDRRNCVNPCCPTVITTINEYHPGLRNRHNLWKKGTSSRDGTSSILEGQDQGASHGTTSTFFCTQQSTNTIQGLKTRCRWFHFCAPEHPPLIIQKPPYSAPN
jgi:hypothetical protein